MIKDLCWELLDDDLGRGCLVLAEEAKPTQSGRSQDHRVDLALPYPLDSGFDIPANRHDLQLSSQAGCPIEDLHGASRRPGPNSDTVSKIIKSLSYENVSSVLPSRNGDDLKIVCLSCGQVLE
jgi:hypothetical protein